MSSEKARASDQEGEDTAVLENPLQETASLSVSARRSASHNFPTEIWLWIISYLAPSFHPGFSSRPHPSVDSLLQEPNKLPSSISTDLASFVETCKTFRDLASPVLFRNSFLCGDDDWLMQAFCTSVTHWRPLPLVGSTSTGQPASSWVRALALPHYHDGDCDNDPQNCSHSKLLHACQNLRYLSICDREDLHSLICLLSWGTRCQPTHLTVEADFDGIWSLYFHPFGGPYAQRPESFASLSQVTHLHLIESACLLPIALLPLTRWHLSHDDQRHSNRPTSASSSLQQPIECLRLSNIRQEVLETFSEFANSRIARAPGHRISANNRVRMPPVFKERYFEKEVQRRLYELLANVSAMPRFRLLILDLELSSFTDNPRYHLPPIDKSKRCWPDAFDHVPPFNKSNEDPMRVSDLLPSRSQVPWFESAIRKVSSQPTYANDVLHDEHFKWHPDQDLWHNRLTRFDQHWQETQRGKHVLMQLFKLSQREYSSKGSTQQDRDSGLSEIEVRVTIGHEFDLIEDERYCPEDEAANFWCECTNLDATTAGKEGGRASTSQGHDNRESSTQATEVGSWADPDVFALVEEKPWLSCIIHPHKNFAFWSGRLPRKSERFDLTDMDGPARPTEVIFEIPPIVDLRESALDELGRQKLAEMRAHANDERP